MKMIEAFKRANNKLEPVSDRILNLLTEILDKKLPKFLARNIVKIYILAILTTIGAMIHAYIQRGYFACGGEAMIILFPAMLDMYLNMRGDE